jgi:hypothetical protein
LPDLLHLRPTVVAMVMVVLLAGGLFILEQVTLR